MEFELLADSIKKINNKRHRELAKDKFKILEIDKNTKTIGYKLTLQMIMQNWVPQN